MGKKRKEKRNNGKNVEWNRERESKQRKKYTHKKIKNEMYILVIYISLLFELRNKVNVME